MGPCTHGNDTRSWVSCSSGTSSNLWRVASWVLKGTHLSAKLEHPCHGNSHKSCGWTGCPCQPGTTGSPSNQDFWTVKLQTTKRMGLGGPGSPRSPRMTRIRTVEVKELLLKWEHLFACSDLDLGKTALIKHKIELSDWMPFREHYWHIPPHMYNDVRAHIQEMLDIGTIHKLHSPWASAVVLVWKKDGSLRFCINLRKLNNWTMKDAYSLPHINETLDSLQGPQWFSSHNLKLGYWQVEMDEESKLLTAFTVGILGLFECKRMPFGLTNAPTTFQRLMKNCLGTSISIGASST